MHTPKRVWGLGLALLATAACVQNSLSDFCLDLDGPCTGQTYGGGSGSYSTRQYVLGFPADHVDLSAMLPSGGYRGILHVGDAIPLRLMWALGDTTDGAGLPMQVVQWALPDSSSARIQSAANGEGILMAEAPGAMTTLIVNQQRYNVVVSCDAQKQCWRLTEIDILP